MSHARVVLDRYVVGTLMRDLVAHDHSPSAFLVYLYLWVAASERRGRPIAVSLQTIAFEVGLSKSAVQASMRLLSRRRLVQVSRASRTAIPEYTVLRPWVR